MVSLSIFSREREQSPSPPSKMSTERTWTMDSRFSMLFTSAQPQLTAPLPAPTSTGTQQQKAETTPTSTTQPEIRDSPSLPNAPRPQIEKMDKRFSTMLFLPSQLSTPPRTPLHSECEGKDTDSVISVRTASSSKRAMKGLLRRVFSPLSSSNLNSGSRPNTSSTCAEIKIEKDPVPTPEELGNRLWADIIGGVDTKSRDASPAPTARSGTVQRSHTVIVPAPASSLKLQSRSRFSQALHGKKTKNANKGGNEPEVIGILTSREDREQGWKRPDSKFSSITSLPSLKSLELPKCSCEGEGGLININTESLKGLESCVRRIRKGLKYQEYLTSHLSNNLVFLFGRKEKQLGMLKRLRSEEKTSLTSSLFRIKESAGRTFLRKAVFLQRSQELVAQLADILQKSRLAASEESILIEIEDRLFDILNLMREDLKTQRELDERLKGMLIEESKEKRWAGSPGERSLMRKFAGFVEGRMGALGGVYTGVEGVVGRMEGVERC